MKRVWWAAAAIIGASTAGCDRGALPTRDDAGEHLGAPSPGPDAAKVRAIVKKLDDKIGDLGGTASIAFVNVGSGDVLGALHEHDPKNPASNAKLATTAAALSILGPGHRFTTGLYGKIEGGVVAELVLRGRGDPTLTIDDLSGMVRELRAEGVTEVKKILVDQSYFDDAFVPPAFDQQPNEWANFRAPVAAVSLDENTFTLWVAPGKKGDPAAITVSPPGFVDVDGSITTAKKGAAESIACAVAANGDRLKATISGKVAEDARLVPIVKRVDDPRRMPGFALAAVLREQGVKTSGEVALGGDGEKRALVSHASRPLDEIVMLLGKESDNFVAEMLLKATGEGKSDSTNAAAGAAAIQSFLDARGAFDTGMKITNGSGLFDANRSTASGVTKLLASVYGDPTIGPEFLAQLSIGGVDGTLKHRFERWSDKKVVRAKTGTLNATIALSGYVLAPPGQAPIAFSILANGVAGKGQDARAAMDEAVDDVAKLVWP